MYILEELIKNTEETPLSVDDTSNGKKIYSLLDSLINIISSLQIIYLNEHPQALHLDKN